MEPEKKIKEERAAEKISTREGTYLSFTSAADHDLITTALLESMWTDKESLIPTENSKWCEVWLCVDRANNDEQNQIADFYNQLESLNITYKRNYILFPERAVLLINANKKQLIELMLLSDVLAEFRLGQEPAGFWVSESSKDQQEWVEDLLKRINIIESDVSICILDSGVNNGHQLISPLLPDEKTLSYSSDWGSYDHEERAGHGTLMAGISAYGNLEKSLSSNSTIDLTHDLISVKILPPRNQEPTPKELWGDVISQSVSSSLSDCKPKITENRIYSNTFFFLPKYWNVESLKVYFLPIFRCFSKLIKKVRQAARAEIESPEAKLVFCMAVTSIDDMERGRPSSWSGAVDNLTYGRGETQRILIVSGGNIRNDELFKDYPNSNLVTSIENPAQSWNALTVGAYTQKIVAGAAQLYFAISTEIGLIKQSSQKFTLSDITLGDNFLKEQKQLAEMDIDDYGKSLFNL